MISVSSYVHEYGIMYMYVLCALEPQVSLGTERGGTVGGRRHHRVHHEIIDLGLEDIIGLFGGSTRSAGRHRGDGGG